MVPFSQSLSTEEWDGFCVCSEDKASNYQAFVLYYITKMIPEWDTFYFSATGGAF